MKPNNLDKNHTLVGFSLLNGFFILAVIILFTWQFIISRRTIVEKAKALAQNSIKINEAVILSRLKSIDLVMDQVVYEVKKESSINRLSELDRTHFLKGLFGVKGVLLTWVDQSGNPIGKEFDNKVSPSGRINYYDRDYFQKLKNSAEGSSLMVSPRIGKLTGMWVVVYAKRLTSRYGHFKGVVMVAITPDFFASIRESGNLNGSDSFTVAAGTPLRYFYRFPESSGVTGQLVTPNSDAADVIQNKIHDGIYDTFSPVDGKHRISGHTWIGSFPFLLVIGFNYWSILQQWINLQVIILAISFAFLIALGVLNYYLYRTELKTRALNIKLQNTTKLAALGEMAAGIAHEVNNPLAIINGSVSLLRRFPGYSEKQELKFASIEKSVARISKIILGLKTFARSAETIESTQECLNDIITEAVDLTTMKAHINGTNLTVSLADNFYIMCKRVEIEQVLINLINNSLDAIAQLSEKWIKIESFEEGSAIVLRLIDSGRGIPSDVAEKLFDPFFTTKPVGQGTGLGLSITKGILTSNHATIELLPDHQNTCFEIRFSKRFNLNDSAA